MKTFCIVHAHTVSETVKIQAKNEKEALKRFREIQPDERIMDVYQIDERRNSNDY